MPTSTFPFASPTIIQNLANGIANTDAATVAQLGGGGGSSYSNANVAAFLASGNSTPISVTGNIRGNLILGNGALLTGLPAGYGNANLNNLGSNSISTTGSVTATYFVGDGANLTGLPSGYSNTQAAAFLAALGANSISTTGSVTAARFVGEGGNVSNIQWTNISGTPGLYANANAVALLAAFGSNTISTTGSVTATRFTGEGGNISNVAAVTAQTVTNAAQPAITSVGTLSSLSVSGTATIANIAGEGSLISNIKGSNVNGAVALATTATHVLDPSQPNITTVGTLSSLSVSGTATISNIAGEGGNISNIQWSNVTGANAGIAAYLPTYTGDITAGNVTVGNTVTANLFVGNFQGNISGNLVVPGLNTQVLFNNNGNAGAAAGFTFNSATGVATATHFAGEAGNLSNITGASVTGNVPSATIANTVTNPAQGNITSVGTLTSLSVSGTATAAHFAGEAGNLSNIYGGNVVGNVGSANTANTVTNPAQSNITSVGILTSVNTSGAISATGNVTAGAFTGNGATLASLTGANVIGTVTAASTAGTVTGNAQGNITSVGTLTSLAVTGIISTAGNIKGEGGNISNIQAASISGQVANALVAGTVYTAAQPAITSVGTLTAVNTSGAISAAGGVTAASFTGNGANLSNITGANVIGNVSSANVANTVTNPAQPNITSVGNLTSVVVTGQANVGSLLASNLSLSGNTVASLGTSTLVLDPRNDGNPSTGDVVILGNVSVTGNVTYVDVSTAITSNLQWTAAANATTPAQATGGGLEVGNAAAPYATWLYNSTANAWVSNIAIVAQGGANINGALSGATTGAFSGMVTAGNITGEGGNISNIAGASVVGNVASATIANTVTNPAQPNITSTGILTALSVSGNVTPGGISTTGNITAGYFIGDGSLLTGLAAGYSNVQAAAFLAALGSNVVSTTGSVTAATFTGNGANLSNITGGNVTGNVPSATIANTVTNPAQGNITSVGTLVSLAVTGTISTAGNIKGEGGNISNVQWTNLVGAPSFYSNANASAFLAAFGSNVISTTGSVTAASFAGDGANLSSITGANVTGTVLAASTAGTVTGNAQGNITSVGVLTSLSVSGALVAANIAGEGNAISNIKAANVVGTVTAASTAGTVTTNAQPNITSVGNLTSLVVTGNVTGNYFIGNGSQLTGLYANANASAYWAGGTNSSNIVSTGSLAIGNTITALPNTVAAFGGNVDSYMQINIQNLSGGSNAESDLVITANNGSDTVNYVNLGLVNSAYDPLTPTNSLGNIIYPADAYLYAQGNAASTAANGGNLAIGTTVGTKMVKIFAGGNTAGNIVGTFSNTGLSVTGNITANYYFGNGSQLTGLSSQALANGTSNITIPVANGNIIFSVAGLPYGALAANSVALGQNSGTSNQATYSVAVGYTSGQYNQGTQSTAIGPYSGQSAQGTNSVAIGFASGQSVQGTQSVAIGYAASQSLQGSQAVSIGSFAGHSSQGSSAVAIGQNSGKFGQGQDTVAIGSGAANNAQSTLAIAIGMNAGANTQGISSIAIGYNAGYTAQAARAIAIGHSTGNNQGTGAIAIGANSVSNAQTANSVVINASGTAITASAAGFYAAPVRNDTSNVTNAVYYNTTTKEVTYGPAGSGGGSYGNSNVSVYLASGTNTANIITTGSLAIGNTITTLPNTVAAFGGNVNSYLQINLQNINSGANAESDFVVTADNGSDTVNYINMGIVNSAYDPLTPSNSLGNIIYPADGYIYSQGNVGNTTANGGNLALGTTVASKVVKIFAGGNTASNIVATVSNVGVSVAGNVTANIFKGANTGFYATPVRNDTANVTNAVFYNTGTNELTYGPITPTMTQSVISGNVTLALNQNGSFLYSTAAGATSITIPSNANVAFPVGATVTVVLQGTGSILLQPQANVNLYLGGNTVNTTRTVNPYGIGTLLKVGTDTWFLNGTGVY